MARRRHRTTASGGQTGLDTPAAIQLGNEAQRYYDLFDEALRGSGFQLMYYPQRSSFRVLVGANQRQPPELPATPENLKNHYCHYRLLDNMDSYVNAVFSTNGVPNYFQDHLVTPPLNRPFTLSYRAL
ncbi:MAG: hypothetical protein EOP48_10545 [Sphingobacteriales bacterium]|nr:MAG: hypothetical protein EOP48_10545 [Sphingobacteriales bacterium]